MAREKSTSVDLAGPVAAYKALLREMVDRRPSGTRQKIAAAIGKHKSFVSQITNPGYSMPVPAKHLSTIFELCHFSPEEKRLFMAAYEIAHPGRSLIPTQKRSGKKMLISVCVPVFNSPERQADVVETIRSFAQSLCALAEKWDEPGEPDSVRSRTGKGRGSR